MRRALALLLSLAMVASMVATPVAAHGSHVRADPQVSDDGTIVVESLFSVNGGYLVVHLDQGGQPGRPVGVADIESGVRSNFEVGIDQRYWDEHDGNRTYWLVLHRDSDPDDGEFDPMVDTPVTGLHGSYVGARIPVGKSADGAARVLAAEYNGQGIDSPSVTLSRVQLNQPGHVVIQTVRSGAPGEIIGTRALDAGTYDDVSVDIDPEVLSSMNVASIQTVAATLHVSDGEEGFQPGSDTTLDVDGEPVRTYFSFEKVENASAPTEPLINTPEGTPQPTETDTVGGSTSAATDDGGGEAGSTAGFGVVGVLVGVALVTLAARRRGR